MSKPTLHGHKREKVEGLLKENLPITTICAKMDIPVGSITYLLRKWRLEHLQLRQTGINVSSLGSKAISEKLKRRHATGKMPHGKTHWKYGKLKLHGKWVPEGEVKTVLEELVSQDMILAQMAEELEVDPKTITNWLRKFDLQQGIRKGKRCSWYKGGWIKDRGPDWLRVRKNILERDNYCCRHCGMTQKESRAKRHALSIHHIIPWRVSHDNGPDNLLTLCQSCHMKEEWNNGIWKTKQGEWFNA